MAATFKVLSALLCYPEAPLQEAANELCSALEAEGLLPEPEREPIKRLIADLAQDDLLSAQENYVELFDRTRALSLHLFEHVHAESRDRGQAMVSLRERYRAAGLEIAANELPDFLPLFLEFLSTLPAAEACLLLREPLHILEALAERLEKRGSGYASVLRALVTLAGTRPALEELAELHAAQVDDPNDHAALDRGWAEAEVRFGPEDGGAGTGDCPRVARMLERMGGPRQAALHREAKHD
jgi:nitrate reductase delta subunit